MIRTDKEYRKTLRQWHRVLDISWSITIRHITCGGFRDESAGLYRMWGHRAFQLDTRLQKYEKTQPRGWRGGRKNSSYLAEVRRKMKVVSQKYPSLRKGNML